MVENFAEQMKRVVLETLIYAGESDIAAMLVDSDFEIDRDTFGNTTILVSVPSQFLPLIQEKAVNNRLRNTIMDVSYGHLFDDDGRPCGASVAFRTRLVPVDPDWLEVVRAQIAQAQATNQGLVTEAAFGRAGKDPVMYGELKFGSMTEVRIAQEFESRNVMFFPLAVAVKAETGVNYKDHREVDFLVIHDGVVGILEVAGPNHNGRQVSDIEKDTWFHSAGIICLKAYPAELCWSDSGEVVDTFLRFMALHKR